MKKKYFNNLKDSDFSHPFDAKALKVLKGAKGLDVVINWLLKWSYEKVQRILHMGNAIRVTPNSYNRLHEMIKLCGDILNMPYPELYVFQNAHVNAYTTGTTSPFIVLSTSIIEALEDEELLAVIAHEMGHIKAKHVLYKQVANVLTKHTNWLGPLKVVLDYTLLLSIANWNRKSELTADRASLLVSQDIDTVVSVLMKISGGSKKLHEEISPQDFIRQSEEYEKLENTISGNAYKLFTNLLGTHPFSVMRVNEIVKWSQTEEYKAIIESGDDTNLVRSKEENEKIKDFSLTVNSDGKVDLSWSAPNLYGIANYHIFRKHNDKDFVQIRKISGTSLRFQNILTEIGTFEYYICASDHLGELFGKTETLKYEMLSENNISRRGKIFRKIENLIQ